MEIDNDGLKTETYGTENIDIQSDNRRSLGRRNKQKRSREQKQTKKEQRTETIWGKAYTEQRTEAIRGKSFVALRITGTDEKPSRYIIIGHCPNGQTNHDFKRGNGQIVG